MKVDPQGLPAQTRWRVLARGPQKTLLELTPLTGRTHQLRVHCAANGFPILGDPIYGTGDREARLHLLARAIEIPLYKNKPPIRAEAPVPPHMQAEVSALLDGTLPDAAQSLDAGA
jgi:tRNA pseudouridine32 synthase/23S rRNA pseudouridine746 synthase